MEIVSKSITVELGTVWDAGLALEGGASSRGEGAGVATGTSEGIGAAMLGAGVSLIGTGESMSSLTGT